MAKAKTLVLKRLFTLVVTGILLFPTIRYASVSAYDRPLDRGLQVSPVRREVMVDSGKTVSGSVVVANLTKNPLLVTISVKQFSVSDYDYKYTFQQPENDWLYLDISSISLAAGQSKTIPYHIRVPSQTKPGGSYYTLFASAELHSSATTDTIQAASLVYLTVNGVLSKVSHLESSSIPWVVTSKEVPFSLEAINTGNIYSYVYVSGQLHGVSVKPAQSSIGHILIPGKVRTLTSSIESPILPGFYRAAYGYKTEGNWTVQESHWILYIPPWSIALALAALLTVGGLYRQKYRIKESTDSTKT